MTHKKSQIFFTAIITISVLSLQAKEITLNSDQSFVGNQHASVQPGDSSSTVIADYFNHCNPSLSIRCSKDGIAIPDSLYIICNSPEMGEFVYPFRGRMLSPYGNKRRHHLHSGVDIKLQAGDTVRCAFNGIVRMARRFHGYGLMVVVQHPNGLETLYAHLSKFLVKPGEEVPAGAPLALGGRTGRATTTHLHFETRFMGDHFDPADLLNCQTFTLRSDTLVAYYRNGDISVFPKGRGDLLVANMPTPEGAKAVVVHKAKGHYVVKKGDTLYSIARRNSMALADLCKMNRVKPGDVLSIGTRLKVK
ncbi:MAG TPA: peptidoglycan DD-metalloendopeptidase family protein [Williamwhitmania sp.]|nr:peptidoglycan DD-metalloendopeptidase family protein [Williamwhitmania sp.]